MIRALHQQKPKYGPGATTLASKRCFVPEGLCIQHRPAEIEDRTHGPPDIGTDLIKEAYSPSAVGALSERETCLVISEREMVAEPGAQSRGLCGR